MAPELRISKIGVTTNICGFHSRAHDPDSASREKLRKIDQLRGWALRCAIQVGLNARRALSSGKGCFLSFRAVMCFLVSDDFMMSKKARRNK